MFKVESGEIALQPDTLLTIKDFPITNSFMSGLLMTALLTLLVVVLNLTLKKDSKPGKLQAFMEIVVMGLYDFIVSICGGSEKTAKRILGIIGTVFIYIGLSNIILIVPPFSAFQYDGIGMFRSHTFDFNTTFSIATLMVIWMQILSIMDYNPFGHIFKYIKIPYVISSFRKGIGPGMISIIEFMFGFLDVIGEFAKIISLSLRLFGNLYAGEILIGLLMGIFALGVPVPLIFVFGIMSGMVQALVFAALSAANMNLAVKGEE